MPTTSPLTTLQDEQALIVSLVELMRQEQRHLVGADIEALTALTAQKSQLIEQMASLARQRHAALGARGFAPEETGMQAWLASTADEAAQALWRELLGQTRSAKELNRVNGMLINRHLAHNQTVLGAMRTPTNGADHTFYGPNGRTTGGGASRRFVVG
ncbi:MAG: flagellar protein FlgN [Pseudomonadota bacterium]